MNKIRPRSIASALALLVLVLGSGCSGRYTYEERPGVPEGYTWVKDNETGGLGVANADQYHVIEPIYTEVWGIGYPRFQVVTPDEKIGLANLDKGIEVQPEHFLVKRLFKNGVIVKSAEGKFGVLEPDLKVRLPVEQVKLEEVGDRLAVLYGVVTREDGSFELYDEAYKAPVPKKTLRQAFERGRAYAPDNPIAMSDTMLRVCDLFEKLPEERRPFTPQEIAGWREVWQKYKAKAKDK